MPKFVTIGYGDQAGYDRTDDAPRARAHEHDARLVDQGAVMGVVGPPVQVRNHDGLDVVVAAGPYMRSDLPVAGISLIEAADLEEAVRLASGTPCAIAYGVVEVWPLVEH